MSLLEKQNVPPETGASRNVAPLVCVSSPISWATAGSIVLVSINNDPGLTLLKENNCLVARTCKKNVNKSHYQKIIRFCKFTILLHLPKNPIFTTVYISHIWAEIRKHEDINFKQATLFQGKDQERCAMAT